MENELTKIVEVRSLELAKLELKEQELIALRNEKNELDSKLASISASKEAQKQDKKIIKADLTEKIADL